MRINAAVVNTKGAPFVVEPVEIDEPQRQEVLVRIAAAGICHTDLLLRDIFPWDRPAVLGHEGAGVVERVGSDVTSLSPGDHVVLTFASCGVCIRCVRGQPAYCDEFRARNFGGARPDGSNTLRRGSEWLAANFFGQSSFASHAIATERNAIKVPTDLPLSLLGPLGCGVQTGAGAVLRSLRVVAGSSIVIFGVGAVGMSAVMAARIAGCATTIAVDIRPSRLELAHELGATHMLDSTQGDVVERVRSLTRGGADYTVETTGIPDVLRQAVTCLVPLGVCGMVGAAAPETSVALPWRDVLFGRSLRGIYEGDSLPGQFIPLLIEFHRQGLFPFERLVAFYPFGKINEAVRDSLTGHTVKPILRISDEN